MNVNVAVDKKGSSFEQFSLSEEEELAIKKAYQIVIKKGGAEYVRKHKERLYWCFLGVLRIGGIAGLEEYVHNAKICKTKRIASAGYSGQKEIEIVCK